MTGNKQHGFHEGFTDKRIFRIFRILKFESINHFRDPVLHLDTSVDFHEIMGIVLDYTLESGNRIQFQSFSKSLCLAGHGLKHGKVFG